MQSKENILCILANCEARKYFQKGTNWDKSACVSRKFLPNWSTGVVPFANKLSGLLIFRIDYYRILYRILTFWHLCILQLFNTCSCCNLVRSPFCSMTGGVANGKKFKLLSMFWLFLVSESEQLTVEFLWYADTITAVGEWLNLL